MTAPDLSLTPRLGCATTYTALIYYWDRRTRQTRFYTELTGIIELNWERVIDDYSECRIRFRPSKGDDCCGKLKPIYDSQGQLQEPGLWVWAHELAIFRDGELVWQGPIFSIDELVMPDETTDHIQITARDFLGWLDRRTLHSNIFTGADTWDLSDIAAEIIRAALWPDDLGILDTGDPNNPSNLIVIPSGRRRKWSVRFWEARAGEELRNVARLGLDFTSVGRRILVKGPKHVEGQPTHQLRSRDFLSGVEIRMVGSEAATGAIAVGATPTDAGDVPIEDIPPVKRYWPPVPAEAIHPFFGLVENWTKSESVHDVGYLDWIASQKVAEGFPPPMTLSIPAGTGLSPEAPVSIHHLVPSTYFTILVNGMCRNIAQLMRLSQVRVSWSQDRAEEVGVAFIPANVLDDTGGDPDAQQARQD